MISVVSSVFVGDAKLCRNPSQIVTYTESCQGTHFLAAVASHTDALYASTLEKSLPASLADLLCCGRHGLALLGRPAGVGSIHCGFFDLALV